MKFLKFTTLLLLSSTMVSVFAQESFPLDGTWRGISEGENGVETAFVIVMNWDGKNIEGRLNPGRNAIPIMATLDPEIWEVTINATSKEGVDMAYTGTLTNIGAYDREINGTFNKGAEAFRFRMIRE